MRIFKVLILATSLAAIGDIGPGIDFDTETCLVNETKFESSPYYTFNTMNFYFNDFTELVSKIDITFNNINLNYKFSLTYINSENSEVYYGNKVYNVNSYITYSNKNFLLDINIPYTDLANVSKFTFNLEIPYIDKEFHYSFLISNQGKYINVDEYDKVYTSCTMTSSSGKEKYHTASVIFYKKYYKDIFYYDYFDFSSLTLMTSAKTIKNAYIFIDDYKTFFSSTFKARYAAKPYRKYKELNITKKMLGDFTFTFKSKLYVNPLNNLSYNEKNDKYYETNSKIYMPLKHYKEYKEVKIGIVIDNFSDFEFSLIKEIDVNFLPNIKRGEATIIKGIDQVTNNDELGDVNI